MINRQSYVEKLEAVQEDVLRMGTLMEEAVEKAIRALVDQDVALAKEVIRDDDVIDDMEHEIEEHCMKIIATEQPVARDLRILFTAMKITTDLERISDNAVNIAKITRKIGKEKHIKPLIDIPRMARLAVAMVRDAVDAYVKLDVDKAYEIIDRDQAVDDLNDQIFRELLTYMMQDPRNITQATYFIFVAKYLERIADHATNISEWIIYIEKGEMI